MFLFVARPPRGVKRDAALLSAFCAVALNIIPLLFFKFSTSKNTNSLMEFIQRGFLKKTAKIAAKNYLTSLCLRVLLFVISISINIITTNCALRFCRVSTCYDAIFEL